MKAGATHKRDAGRPKPLSVREIRRRFPNEWVLLMDPQHDSTLAVTSGTVVEESKDRDEVYRKARDLKLKRVAILYTGKFPKDMAIVL
jgi:hypothetical protein